MQFIIVTVALAAIVLLSFANSFGGAPEKRIVSRIAFLGAVIGWGIFFVTRVALVVPAGNVAVGTFFGTVQKEAFDQGLHVPVSPFMDFHLMSVRQQALKFQSGAKTAGESDDVVAVSSEAVPLSIDVTYFIVLNPKFAWWVYRNIGDEGTYRERLIPAAAAGSRDASAEFGYEEAMTTKRDAIADKMQTEFARRIIATFSGMGLPAGDAAQVFSILPVQLRMVMPPEKVLNSISDKAAAAQDLQRQPLLTAIAAQQAQRRANEGTGVKNLFDNLPKGFRSSEIASVLVALGSKERADALTKAVETGKVGSIIFEGSGAPAINVQGGQ